MKRFLPCVLLFFLAATAQAQIQVRLSFKRLQYIAHEPVIATMTITNLAGRDIELHDDNESHWFGFEITANDGRSLQMLLVFLDVGDRRAADAGNEQSRIDSR